jgi:hypothetical protein
MPNNKPKKHGDIPHLRWWHPADSARLLWWLSYQPERLVAHDATYGEDAKHATAAVMLNVLTWLPLLLGYLIRYASRPALLDVGQIVWGILLIPTLVVIELLMGLAQRIPIGVGRVLVKVVLVVPSLWLQFAAFFALGEVLMQITAMPLVWVVVVVGMVVLGVLAATAFHLNIYNSLIVVLLGFGFGQLFFYVSLIIPVVAFIMNDALIRTRQTHSANWRTQAIPIVVMLFYGVLLVAFLFELPTGMLFSGGFSESTSR